MAWTGFDRALKRDSGDAITKYSVTAFGRIPLGDRKAKRQYGRVGY